MFDKSDYLNIEIPDELDAIVDGAILEGKRQRKGGGTAGFFKKTAATAAALVISFVTLLNVSPTLAQAAYQIPVLGDLCRVVTFREYHFEDDAKYVDAKIPQVENTGKSDLEERVNLETQKKIDECIKENEEVAESYYKAFVETGGNPEDFKPVGITVDYDIKSIDEEYVSFVIYQYGTAFNAYNHEIYYNLDLESGKNLTLKDWLGNDYREIAVTSIESTISQWSEEQKAMLWDDLSIIDHISEDTDFYINDEGKAVVVFERYEIAVGAAGSLEFTIQ